MTLNNGVSAEVQKIPQDHVSFRRLLARMNRPIAQSPPAKYPAAMRVAAPAISTSPNMRVKNSPDTPPNIAMHTLPICLPLLVVSPMLSSFAQQSISKLTIAEKASAACTKIPRLIPTSRLRGSKLRLAKIPEWAAAKAIWNMLHLAQCEFF